MKVIDPGHRYSLSIFDGDDPCELRFMKRVGDGYPGNTGSAYSGTNCQDVIRVLIDRVQYLNGQIHDVRNSIILMSLRDALFAFELRAAERHNRKLSLDLGRAIERAPSCGQCGHILCDHLSGTRG